MSASASALGCSSAYTVDRRSGRATWRHARGKLPDEIGQMNGAPGTRIDQLRCHARPPGSCPHRPSRSSRHSGGNPGSTASGHRGQAGNQHAPGGRRTAARSSRSAVTTTRRPLICTGQGGDRVVPRAAGRRPPGPGPRRLPRRPAGPRPRRQARRPASTASGSARRAMVRQALRRAPAAGGALAPARAPHRPGQHRRSAVRQLGDALGRQRHQLVPQPDRSTGPVAPPAVGARADHVRAVHDDRHRR